MLVNKIKSRLQKRKSVRLSAFVILASIIISVFGYHLCPDNTPHANDGAVELGKNLPFYSADFIKIRRNRAVPENNWFATMISGQESKYAIVPYKDYEINGLTLKVEVVGKDQYFKEYDLIDVAYPVSKALVNDSSYYEKKGDTLSFYDINDNLIVTTIQELKEDFVSNNLESRFYLLGTDRFGRDILSRLIIGTRVSIFIGFASVIISLILGMILGTLSGYFGGIIDNFVMWLMSVVWSVPGIMLVIAISMALNSKGVWVTFIAVGLTTWVEAARVIRGQVKSLKEKQFVEAARAYGLRNYQIVFRHIVPNIYSSLIVIATANYAVAILLEAGLSFLGLSVQPPSTSWGIMVYEGYQVLGTRDSWHMILFPGLAIIIMVLSFNLLGIGLQQTTTPQRNRRHL